ncbi:MAG TPA: SDR family NAD(P)-dependent oxidoreductase [Actinomycetes bacterium]|nr:SDR family NAD(P)-dependent oxidoreductase [Actinomycetes bacterium]
MGNSVVVTGATSGIGLATAVGLAESGYDVIGTARTEEAAQLLHDAAKDAGAQVRHVCCDVADATSTVRAFTEIATMTGGGPWAVVNNAGFAQPGAIEDVTDDAVRAQLEVNLIAPARIARLVLPAMRQRRSGRIINISSISGRITLPFVGWYAASKHGLEAITDALRIEVARFGVRVVLIEPGGYGTPIWQRGLDRMPDPAGSAYKQSYGLAGQVLNRAGELPPPLPVVRVVRKALAAHRPRDRYLVGREARSAAALEALLPTWLGDYAKGAAVGLQQPPPLLAPILTRLARRRTAGRPDRAP